MNDVRERFCRPCESRTTHIYDHQAGAWLCCEHMQRVNALDDDVDDLVDLVDDVNGSEKR